MTVVLFFFFSTKGTNRYTCISALRNLNNILSILFKHFKDKFYLVQSNAFVLVHFKCHKECSFITAYFAYHLCIMVVAKVIIFISYKSFIGKSMQNINAAKTFRDLPTKIKYELQKKKLKSYHCCLKQIDFEYIIIWI